MSVRLETEKLTQFEELYKINFFHNIILIILILYIPTYILIQII